MHHSPVSHAHIVRNVQRDVVGRMHDRAVLEVDPSADANGSYVTTDGHVVHDCGLIPQCDIPTHVGRRSDEHVFTECRGNCLAHGEHVRSWALSKRIDLDWINLRMQAFACGYNVRLLRSDAA